MWSRLLWVLLVAIAVGGCGGGNSSPSASGSPTPAAAAAAAYLAIVDPYNAAEEEISGRETTSCDLTTGILANCQKAYRDDAAATESFLTALKALAVPADARGDLDTFIRHTAAELTALQHAAAATTLVENARILGAEVLPAQLTSHHDAIRLRADLGLAIPTSAATASGSPRPT